MTTSLSEPEKESAITEVIADFLSPHAMNHADAEGHGM